MGGLEEVKDEYWIEKHGGLEDTGLADRESLAGRRHSTLFDLPYFLTNLCRSQETGTQFPRYGSAGCVACVLRAGSGEGKKYESTVVSG